MTPVAAFMLALLGLGAAQAQTWPAKPLRLVVAAPAGSSLDVLARVIGDKLGDRLGAKIVVDDRPAAGGTAALARMIGLTSQAVSQWRRVPAARVIEAFDRPFQIAGYALEVRASVGRALWPQDADELEELMHHADAAMYRAKRATRAVS